MTQACSSGRGHARELRVMASDDDDFARGQRLVERTYEQPRKLGERAFHVGSIRSDQSPLRRPSGGRD